MQCNLVASIVLTLLCTLEDLEPLLFYMRGVLFAMRNNLSIAPLECQMAVHHKHGMLTNAHMRIAVQSATKTP